MPKLRKPRNPVPVGYEIYRNDGKHSAYYFGRAARNRNSSYVELYFYLRAFDTPRNGPVSEGDKFARFRWLAPKSDADKPLPWFGNEAMVRIETGSSGMIRFTHGSKLIEYIVKLYGFSDEVSEEDREYWISEGDYGDLRNLEPHTLVRALADIGVPRIVEDGRNSGRWTPVDSLLPPSYDLYLDNLEDDTKYYRGRATAKSPYEARGKMHDYMIESNMDEGRISSWLEAGSPVIPFLQRHHFELNQYSVYRPIPIDTKACLLLEPAENAYYHIGMDYTKWLEEAPTY